MTQKTLLIEGGEPFLGVVLAEQLDGWRIRTEAAAEGENEPDAALLAGAGDHMNRAARLRGAGMIGPIFSLGDTSPPPPLIGLSRPLRVSTLLQRLRAPDPAWIDGTIIGGWRLDATQRLLTSLDGTRIERLTDKELALLQLILVTLPRPVDRETLQTEIWRYHAEAETHTVETHVWRLRQKLEDDPSNPDLLVTVADGYTLKLR